MKVIDLINDIYNNKKLPKQIKIDGIIYHLAENYKNYNINFAYEDDESYWLGQVMLDDEVEIIEEEKDIEELEKDVEFIEHPENEYPNRIEKKYYYDRDKMGNKINELVRAFNQIKKEGK